MKSQDIHDTKVVVMMGKHFLASSFWREGVQQALKGGEGKRSHIAPPHQIGSFRWLEDLLGWLPLLGLKRKPFLVP